MTPLRTASACLGLMLWGLSTAGAATLEPGEADLAYEGSVILEQDAGADWRLQRNSHLIDCSTHGRVLSIQMLESEPGSDGGGLTAALEPDDDAGGAHTIDLQAARPGNLWNNMQSSAAGAGASVRMPVEDGRSRQYAIILGQTGENGSASVTDRITVMIYGGGKYEEPQAHPVDVPGLNIEQMNRYRMAMDRSGLLRVYVNDLAEPVFEFSQTPVRLDAGATLFVGLISPRTRGGLTRLRLDVEHVRVKLGEARFEPPGVVEATPRPAADVVTGDKVVLSHNGVSACTIVLPKEPDDLERLAAAELADYLEKVTGARPPLASSPDDTWTNIYVGYHPHLAAQLSDVSFDELGADGVVIRTMGKDLILSGGRLRGGLNAVYTFLQDAVGVRWWADDAEYVPSQPDLAIPPTNLAHRPPFDLRHFRNGALIKKQFAIRMRQNGGIVHYDTGDHTMRTLLPPEKYFVDHPDWYMYSKEDGSTDYRYSYVNGLQYVKDGRPQAWYETAKATRRLPWQPCITHPDVLPTITANVLELLKAEYPTWVQTPKVVWVSQNDGYWMCTCERCDKARESEGSDSGVWVRFVNEVAQRVEKDYPDVLVATMAYAHTQSPPKHARARDNVIVYYAALGRNHAMPIAPQPQIADEVRGWDRITKHLYIWDYETNFRNWMIPHPNHFVLAENLRFYARHGVTGMMVQSSYGNGGTEFQNMRAYVTSQMMWDPDQDDRKIMEEFLSGYYAAAGPDLMRWILLQTKAIQGKSVGAYEATTKGWLTLEVLNEGTRLYDQAAEKVAGDPVLSERVARARLGLDLVWLQRYNDLLVEAKDKRLPFRGPRDPFALLDRFTDNEYQVETFRENVAYDVLLKELREQSAAWPSAAKQ